MAAPEEIDIAAKWENKGDDGYIGEGFTKRGVYVSVFTLMPMRLLIGSFRLVSWGGNM